MRSGSSINGSACDSKTALTEAWQPRLRAIAAQLPEQAWLTRLDTSAIP
jgi:hypothetical protein